MIINKKEITLSILLILCAAIVSLYPCVNNGFTNWDDDVYVTNNIHIRSLSPRNFVAIFSSYYYGGYIPLTILSFASNYHFTGLSANSFHLTNLIIHLCNCLLVFWLLMVLTKKTSISLITALLFAIHPLHVESVAWITERKDMLFALFFLGALISYYYYLQHKAKRNYCLSLILFAFSLLSKPSAVSLPLVLLLIDYLTRGKSDKNTLLEKIPFFLLSLVFTIIAVIGQRSVGAVHMGSWLSIPYNVILSMRILLFYLYQTILPIRLSCLYPGPETIGRWQSAVFLLAPLIIIVLVLLIVFSRKFGRKIIFGSLFFVFTVSPVMQIIPAGQSIADRYAYIPLIGIFYLAATGWRLLLSKANKILRIALVACLVIVIGLFSYTANKGCGKWRDGITLWTDVIGKFPALAKPYNNRGILYAQARQYDDAMRDLNRSLAINPGLSETYNNRGLLYYALKKYESAINDFNQALALKGNYAEIHNNRGNVYYAKGEIDKAIADFDDAIKMKPDYAVAYQSRGLCLLARGKTGPALTDLSKALEINPFLTEAYNFRGSAYAALKNYDLAIADFSRAININPQLAEAYNNRGIAYCYEKEYLRGIADFTRAIAINSDYTNAYMNRGNAHAALGDLNKAIEDFGSAIERDHAFADAYYNRAVAHYLKKNYEQAFDDLTECRKLGYKVPQEFMDNIYQMLKKNR